jgi:prevent-host-death family protein
MTIPYREVKDRLEEVLQAAANGQPVTLTLENGQQVVITAARKRGLLGSSKGKIVMSEDFDAPLEDFREYME